MTITQLRTELAEIKAALAKTKARLDEELAEKADLAEVLGVDADWMLMTLKVHRGDALISRLSKQLETSQAVEKVAACGHPRPANHFYITGCRACATDWAAQQQGVAAFVCVRYKQQTESDEPCLEINHYLSCKAAAKLMSNEGKMLKTTELDGRHALVFVPFQRAADA